MSAIFFHNKSTNTIFSYSFLDKRTAPLVLAMHKIKFEILMFRVSRSIFAFYVTHSYLNYHIIITLATFR